MTATKPLKAPFPYFGGKSKVAALVWSRLGDVRNYIEPFAGSAAMLLLRPHAPKVETINDVDCFIANFWRAVKHDKSAVVAYCDWPVNECDLHARHKYLVLSDDAVEFRRRMRSDPEFFEPRIAGWWVWGQCMWIGAGWCTNNPAVATPETETRPHLGSDGGGQGINRPIKLEIPTSHGKGVHAKRPSIGDGNGSDGAKGIHAFDERNLTTKLPSLSGTGVGKGVHAEGLRDGNRIQLADQFARGRGVHANDAASVCADRSTWLESWFARLQDRLRSVRICCGDFERVCDSPSVTTRIASGKDQFCGVFLDPPYAHEVDDTAESDLFGNRKKSNWNRDARLYGHDDPQIAARVRDWCLKWGPDPKMRIALCGYKGEHDELEAVGWTVDSWETNGGYGNRNVRGNENKKRERIWFSPACIKANAEVPCPA